MQHKPSKWPRGYWWKYVWNCKGILVVRPGLERRGGFTRSAAHGLIRAYQLSLSSIAGSHCRHLPTCSAYMDEAIARHGLWAGGWMGLARLCRCQPWGTAGFDPVPAVLPESAYWAKPWRYGRWRGPIICEPCTQELCSPDPADH